MTTIAYGTADDNDWERRLPQFPQINPYNPIPNSRPFIPTLVFIELTEMDSFNGGVIKKTNIPAHSIIEFYEVKSGVDVYQHTRVKTTNLGQCDLCVQETPEEIKQLIKDAQNG